MSDSSQNFAKIPDRLDSSRFSSIKNWETLLLTIAIVIFVISAFSSEYFLNPWSLSDATEYFNEKAIVAFAMGLLIISGEIDLSVAAIIALASTAMGYANSLGGDTTTLVIVGLSTGLLCGAFNGVLVTVIGMPSIVATIGTLSLFRGISQIILGNKGFKGYPSDFSFFGQDYLFWVIRFETVICILSAIIFIFLLRNTNFGRSVYAIGNNATAAQFSGIKVQKIKFILFLLTGLTAGIASILLTSRLGSTRPNIALGWELEIVTMVVLGGVNILGGSGRILGVVIAAVLLGIVRFEFNLFNVPGIVMSIFVGALLITVIGLPRLISLWSNRR